MKSSVPWSVRGIDEHTRDAALEAARRAGLSVGAWLDKAIAERAAEEGVDPARVRAREFDEAASKADAGAIARAVEQLAERLISMDASSRAAITGLKERLDEIEESLGRAADQGVSPDSSRSLHGVSAMIDRLAREIDNADERARSMVESGPRGRSSRGERARDAGVDRFQEAIRELDQRIARMSSAIQSPPQPADRNANLEEIRDRLNTLLATANPPAAKPQAAALEATLRSLDAKIDRAKSLLTAPRAAARPPILGSEEDQIGRIEARLAAIAGRLDRRSTLGAAAGKHPSDSQLADAIAEISAHQRALDEQTEAKPDQRDLAGTIANLRADISGLADKVSSLGRIGAEDQEALLGLARRIDALVAERTPDRDLLTKIRAGLDALGAATDAGDRGRLDALGAEVSALRRQLEAADSPGMLTRLETRIAELSRNLDAAVNRNVPPAAIERIESRLDEIAARIDGVLDTRPADQSPKTDRMAALLDRLERLTTPQVQQLAALDEIKAEIAALRREMSGHLPPSGANLERQISELASRIETASRPEASAAAISQLEVQVTQLSEELERSRLRWVALAKVEEDLARMQRHLSEDRQESLEAARAAARDAVRELGGIVGSADEGALIKSLREDLDALRSAAAAPDRHAATTLGSVHDILGKVVERLNRLERETAGRSPAQPNIPRADRWVASAADNRPLEPGSGKPDLAALRGLSGTSAAEQKPADRRADFIAAARRAAQAAAAEAAATMSSRGTEKTEAGEPRQSAFARIGQAIRNRRRPLLLAAAAIVLAIGALQIFKGLRGYGTTETLVADARPQAIGKKTPTDRDVVAESGSIAPAAARGDWALVAPTARDSASIAFAAPEVFDSGTVARADDELATGAVGDRLIADETTHADPTLDPGIGSEKLVQAAQSGDPVAAFEVAARFAEGNGVRQDLGRAAQWYQRAAEGGVAVAQYRLGSLYERGQGVAKDRNAAVNWYRRAADQGNIEAMHNLAVMMSEGVDGIPDHAKALQWFLAAGDYGVKDSQYNLGVIYARGIGTPQNLVDSYKWFAVAAQQGDADAAGRRDEVAKVLSPDDLARARAAVQAYRAKPPPAEANGVKVPPGGWEEFETVSEADRQALVRKIQALLSERGYDPGPADGFEGPKTRQAVMAFQKRTGLAETGRIDGVLIAAIEDMTG